MGGKTSYKSTKKYQDKTYERINVLVPKGKRDEIKSYAVGLGISVNDLIKQAIQEKTGIDMKRHEEIE